MSPAQIAFFKRRLKDKADDLSERMRRNQVIFFVERQPDQADAAATEELRSLTLNIIERDKKVLANIARALEMIESGNYGYCHETGEPIGLERLLALPESLYSVEFMRMKEVRSKHLRQVV
ncbi:hypothetical protein BK671_14425 [Pseudomonas fluorescens]|uniref:Uncharacterized protein n=2 Tax=Pseudomonas fluorescens TaxID=294 RepID=A0A423LGG6_PSEFL|nr:hypothetical protein BK671_14425 [Pseudomonas fluorescens]